MTLALGFSLILSLLMVLVMVLDIRHYLIPNTLNLALAALYALAAYFLGLPYGMALATAAIALFFGLGIFTFGLMGGGDVKLLVVLLLWTGWTATSAQFLMLTAAFGGILVVVVLLARAVTYAVVRPQSDRNLPRILTRKQPVPYGVAIAGAFLFLLQQGSITGLPAPF